MTTSKLTLETGCDWNYSGWSPITGICCNRNEPL